MHVFYEETEWVAADCGCVVNKNNGHYSIKINPNCKIHKYTKDELKEILPEEMLSYGDFSNKDAVHFRNGWNACRDEVRQLIDCEIDCIKSGNGVTPSEQNVAIKTAKNIEIRLKDL